MSQAWLALAGQAGAATIGPIMSHVRSIPIEERHVVRRLINPQAVSDAMAAYYALEHPPERTRLFGYFPEGEVISAFLAVAQTGLDLFRPLAVPFAATSESLMALLEAALDPARPHLVMLPVEQEPHLERGFACKRVQVGNLLRLDTRAFEPVINVLTVEKRNQEGWPRFEIQARGGGFAAAGLNWRSAFAAEMYVEADEVGRRRGFSRSVLSALISRLWEERLKILFRVVDDDYGSFEDAFDLGFVPTGVRTSLLEIERIPAREP